LQLEARSSKLAARNTFFPIKILFQQNFAYFYRQNLKK